MFEVLYNHLLEVGILYHLFLMLTEPIKVIFLTVQSNFKWKELISILQPLFVTLPHLLYPNPSLAALNTPISSLLVLTVS